MRNSWPRTNLAKSFEERGQEGTIVEPRALFGSNICRCGHKALKYLFRATPESHFLATVGELPEDPKNARTLTSYSIVSIS